MAGRWGGFLRNDSSGSAISDGNTTSSGETATKWTDSIGLSIRMKEGSHAEEKPFKTYVYVVYVSAPRND